MTPRDLALYADLAEHSIRAQRAAVAIPPEVLRDLVATVGRHTRLNVDVRGLLAEASSPIECHESVGKPCALLCDRWRKKLREALS